MRRLLSLATLLAAVPASAAPPDRPNVVLILADDLGWAELGCHGQKKIRTPALDRMAAEGMRFTQFYAGSPVCAPSRCCLLTGKHGGHAFVRDNREVKPEGQLPLPAGEVTLAELFREKGYSTAAAGKWGLGPMDSEGSPLKQGFDHFYGFNCQRHAHNHYPTWLWDDDRKVELEGNTGGATGKQFTHDLFEARALHFLDAHKDGPFFLYLPFAVPHLALQAPADALAEYKGKFEEVPYDGNKDYQPHPTPRAAYAAMVTRLDRSVGRVLGKLKELGLDEKTLVLFTSDNGPTFEVGGADSAFFGSAGGLRGLKGSVYEGGIRVPLLVRWPGHVPADTVSDLPGYFPDLLPTLADACGLTAPAGIDGVSLLPTLVGKPEKQAKRPAMVWEFAGSGGQQAIRVGDWKGVRQNLRKGPAALELYDLKTDPAEKENVAAKHPAIVRQLEATLKDQHIPSTEFPLPGLGDPAPPAPKP